MASIKLTVNTNFADASKDIKSLGALTEAETKRMDKGLKNLSTESLDKFERNLKRTTAAIKATKGPTEAMRAQQRILAAQIQRSIKAGIDPLDSSLVKLQKEYADTTGKIEQTTKAQKKAEAQAKRNEQAMVALKVAVVAFGIKALKAFIDFSNEAAKAASDAEEVAGKYNVVFKELVDGGESMAKSLSDDFDLASSTAQKLLGDTGDLLTGFGLSAESAATFADETNRLALDLASFTNAQGGATAVSKALTSAYANEREALKTYGIVISQAMVDARLLANEQAGLTFESEKEAIAFATLSLATEQSKNAIGDYARTSESAANVSRRLEESQKSLKEEFGVMVLEGLTPLRSSLEKVTSAYAEMLSEQNKARGFMNDFKDGSIETELSLQELEATLEGLLKKQGQYGVGAKLNDEIQAVKVLIDTYGMQDTFLVKAKESQLALARAADDAAKAEKAKLDIQAAAAGKLEEMQEANLTTSEKQIKALQDQINYWVQFRDITGVQALINELVGDRNTLLEEQARLAKEAADAEAEAANNLETKLKSLHNAEAIAYNNRIASFQEFLSARMEQEGIGAENRLAFLAEEEARVMELENLSNEDRLAAQEAFHDATIEAEKDYSERLAAVIKDRNQAKIDAEKETRENIFAAVQHFNDMIMTVVSNNAQSEINEINEKYDKILDSTNISNDRRTELEAERDAEIKKIEDEALKRKILAAKITKATEISSAIAATASGAINAYKAMAGIPVVGPALGVAAAAAVSAYGALKVGVISSTPLPSAETGGRFTVPEASGASRSDNIGMNVNPGETVQVFPRGEESSRGITVNNYLDRELLYSVMQEGFDAGEINITTDNIQEAV